MNPVFLLQYYHEESGVYIGPAHAFDDVDLDYLNNEEEHNDEAEALVKVKPSPPISSLSLDSLSGIYLGFAEKIRQEEQSEEARDVNDINVTIIPEETVPADLPNTPSKGRFFDKAKRIKEKISKPSAEDFTCFKIFRK